MERAPFASMEASYFRHLARSSAGLELSEQERSEVERGSEMLASELTQNQNEDQEWKARLESEMEKFRAYDLGVTSSEYRRGYIEEYLSGLLPADVLQKGDLAARESKERQDAVAALLRYNSCIKYVDDWLWAAELRSRRFERAVADLMWPLRQALELTTTRARQVTARTESTDALVRLADDALVLSKSLGDPTKVLTELESLRGAFAASAERLRQDLAVRSPKPGTSGEALSVPAGGLGDVRARFQAQILDLQKMVAEVPGLVATEQTFWTKKRRGIRRRAARARWREPLFFGILIVSVLVDQAVGDVLEDHDHAALLAALSLAAVFSLLIEPRLRQWSVGRTFKALRRAGEHLQDLDDRITDNFSLLEYPIAVSQFRHSLDRTMRAKARRRSRGLL